MPSSSNINMKILFVLEHFYPYIGGSEKLFYELTTKLAAQGFDITVVTSLYDKKLPLVESHKNVKIVRGQMLQPFWFHFSEPPQNPKVWQRM